MQRVLYSIMLPVQYFWYVAQAFRLSRVSQARIFTNREKSFYQNYPGSRGRCRDWLFPGPGYFTRDSPPGLARHRWFPGAENGDGHQAEPVYPGLSTTPDEWHRTL